MGFDFNQGDTNRLYLTVLRLSGAAPSFPADYSAPELRISHINGGSEVEDLAFTTLTQIGSTNQWFNKFDISAGAPFVKHLVTYKTTIDTVESFATEEFKVVPVSGTTPGTGAFDVTVQVKNGLTLVPIPNATVRVFDKGNPQLAIATSVTDLNGFVTFFLDTGNYLIEFSKTGVIAEVHDLVVFSDGTHDVVGS